jgi:hypothetical protein
MKSKVLNPLERVSEAQSTRDQEPRIDDQLGIMCIFPSLDGGRNRTVLANENRRRGCRLHQQNFFFLGMIVVHGVVMVVPVMMVRQQN